MSIICLISFQKSWKLPQKWHFLHFQQILLKYCKKLVSLFLNYFNPNPLPLKITPIFPFFIGITKIFLKLFTLHEKILFLWISYHKGLLRTMEIAIFALELIILNWKTIIMDHTHNQCQNLFKDIDRKVNKLS